MSKFIPYSALIHEQIQQEKRRAYGLKVGEHIKFPNEEEGPFIVKKSRLEALPEEQIEALKIQGQKYLDSQKKPKKSEPTNEV